MRAACHVRNPCAQNVDHLAHNRPFSAFLSRWSALWALHRCEWRPHHRLTGGIALHEAPTRRRHTPGRLHVVQNPRRHRYGGRPEHLRGHKRRRKTHGSTSNNQRHKQHVVSYNPGCAVPGILRRAPTLRVPVGLLAVVARAGPQVSGVGVALVADQHMACPFERQAVRKENSRPRRALLEVGQQRDRALLGQGLVPVAALG